MLWEVLNEKLELESLGQEVWVKEGDFSEA